MDLFSNKSGASAMNVEAIDQMQELLQLNLKQNDLPECGNLRSTKRKDVMQRIKCIQELLKMHRQSLDFKKTMKEEGKIVESHETQLLKENLKRHETSLLSLNLEN